jgi:hypothetical protein
MALMASGETRSWDRIDQTAEAAMSNETKKPWTTPKLIVLGKLNSEESVLMGCVDDGSPSLVL